MYAQVATSPSGALIAPGPAPPAADVEHPAEALRRIVTVLAYSPDVQPPLSHREEVLLALACDGLGLDEPVLRVRHRL